MMRNVLKSDPNTQADQHRKHQESYERLDLHVWPYGFRTVSIGSWGGINRK
jgi:hypothetical protein